MKKSEKTEKDSEFLIRVNERQLRLVLAALEEYFRLRMGQTTDLADALAFQHFDYKDHTEEEFKQRLWNREDCKRHLELAMDAASQKNWKHWYKTEEVLTAIDMWSVLRNFFWKQRPQSERDPYAREADPVFLWGPEPGIVIEEVKEDEEKR